MDALSPNQAFDLQASVVQQVASQRSSWVPLARRLSTFHAGKGWKALGLDSFNEWLAQPEISLNRGEAYSMMRAWRELVEDREVDPLILAALDISKVAVILPAIKKGAVEVDEALSDCEVLSRSDLRARYIKPSEAEYRICEHCGSRVKTTAE